MSAPDLSHRSREQRIRVVGADGQPLANTEVSVEQKRHAVQFGCTGLRAEGLESELGELWLGLFDTATLPFYWGRYEPERGGPTQRAEREYEARWFADRGVRLKGHPLVWHTVKATWADQLPLPEVEELLRGRIRREVSDFAGLVDSWDAINEVVIMPVFENEPDGIRNAITRMCEEKGRVEMVRLAFEEARSQGTNPMLVLNDFDLSADYERLVEDVLAAGIEIDAIGLQSHMHKGFKGREYVEDVNERFARFGLPLHWTENTILSGEVMPREFEDLNDFKVTEWPSTPEGEERQAREIVEHYTTLLAHPSVESITYWGLSDTGLWLNAPGGFVRADGTPKPSYAALQNLVRGEWWYQPTTLRTDADGGLTLTGWNGDYAVSAADVSAQVSLAGDGATVEAQLA